MKKVMIIEDDKDIRNGVRILLESQEYEVKEAENGEQALSLFDNSYHLLIVDIMMPRLSGIDVCKEIRKKSYVPILFLTAKSSDMDKIEGLSAGGDDYLVKPFSYMELIARVKALLRRRHEYDGGTELITHIPEKTEWIERGVVSINTWKNQVYLSEEEINLTETEYKILLLFMKYPNKVFTVENIFESVWDEPYILSSSNTVMVHIKNIRNKLKATGSTKNILRTVWGEGYKLEV